MLQTEYPPFPPEGFLHVWQPAPSSSQPLSPSPPDKPLGAGDVSIIIKDNYCRQERKIQF